MKDDARQLTLFEYVDEEQNDSKDKKLTLEYISEQTGKSIKYLRREIASGKLKRDNDSYAIRVWQSDFEKWFNSLDNHKSIKKNKGEKYNDVINWVDISSEMNRIDGWNNHQDTQDINFIDLFAGAGGLSCGLVMAGMTPVGSVEIMPEAVATYKHNFGEVRKFRENLENRDIKEKAVKKHLIDSVKDKHIHLIAGGFPCQGFSMAGNRIVTDPRNSLYLDMLEIVSEIKPDFVLMENVEGLRSMMDGKIEEKIIADYKEIGYEINVTILNSADYGVPQTRRRVIFIGNRLGLKNYHPKPFYNETNYRNVRWAIEKYMSMDENPSINHIMTKHTLEMQEKIKNTPVGKSLYKNYSDAWKKVAWDKPSCTIKENHGGVNIHPLLNRAMTPRELAALQSFPDNFIFKGSKKWQLVQIGNAVPPVLAKAIGLAIIKAIKGDTKNVAKQIL